LGLAVAPCWRLLLILLGASFSGPFAVHSAAALSFSGTVHYSGSLGPVAAAKPIIVALSPSASVLTPHVHAKVAADGGSFTLNVATAGNYYLWFFLDVNHDGHASVGEPFQLYNQRFVFPIDPMAAPQSGLTLEFDDTALFAGVAGTVTYSGSLAQVGPSHPLIVERFATPNLTGHTKSAKLQTNGGRYDFITFDTNTYYVQAFVDLNANHKLDAGEPFAIYNNRSMPPGDPVVAGPEQTGIDMSFGDAQVGMPTPTPTSTPTPTPAPGTCVGDCKASGSVSVEDLVTMVAVGLGTLNVSSCRVGDANHDGQITVDEILKAVSNALNGCGG
jgi:hypothetical protein